MVHIKFDNKNVIFQYIILRGINSCYLCQLSQMHPRTLYALNIDLSHVRRTALEDRDWVSLSIAWFDNTSLSKVLSRKLY